MTNFTKLPSSLQGLPYWLHTQNQKAREEAESLSRQKVVQIRPIMKEEKKTVSSSPDCTGSRAVTGVFRLCIGKCVLAGTRFLSIRFVNG